MTGYAVVIEGEGDSYSAYVPELPGCIATGTSRTQVEQRIREAIDFHIDALREAGEVVPKPTTTGTTIVEVA
jgi:predicted RNase H-like HicB family nuclease